MTEKIEDDESNRRSFIRRLAAAGGAGAAGLLLQQELIKSVSAAGAAGQVAFYTAPDTLTGDNNLFWDDNNKRLGVGTTVPARSVHLVGNNACFRMDRDVNSSAFILVRTALGDFTTIWKTFYVGVDASGVNNGEFFIGDVGTNVSGPSAKRLWIDNSGGVHIPNLIPSDITLANDFIITEDEKHGIAFKNDAGEKIAVLDREGNFHIKGKVMEDL